MEKWVYDSSPLKLSSINQPKYPHYTYDQKWNLPQPKTTLVELKKIIISPKILQQINQLIFMILFTSGVEKNFINEDND